MCVLHRDRVATLYRFFVLNCYSPTCNFRGVGDIPSPEPTHPENRDFFFKESSRPDRVYVSWGNKYQMM